MLAIQKYVGKRSPRGASRIWVRIVERVANQADMPFAAPLERGGPARSLVVNQTQYVVTYLVDGDELRVLTVQHAAQRKSLGRARRDDEAIDHALLAGFLERHRQLVAFDGADAAVAEFLVEDAVAAFVGGVIAA